MERFDLQRFRKDKKLTQKELTDILGCTQPFISSIEKGNRQLPQDMLLILQSKYGNITEYLSEVDGIFIPDTTPLDLVVTGSEVYAELINKLIKNKQLAPYAFLEEKDKEIRELNREIGRLEAQLEASKKADAQEGGNVIFADAK